ncbi:HNH endonuclease signature motif containing protein [Actinosynnema sp. NPDC091369]
MDGHHEDNPVRCPPAVGLLGLQQAAGNQAVTLVVQRMRRKWQAEAERDRQGIPFAPSSPFSSVPPVPSGQQAPAWPTPTPTPTPATAPTPGPAPKRPRLQPPAPATVTTTTTTTTTVTAPPIPPRSNAPADVVDDIWAAAVPEGKRPRTIEVVPRATNPSLVQLLTAAERQDAADEVKRLFDGTMEKILEEVPNRHSTEQDATLHRCGACGQYATAHYLTADHRTPWSKVVESDFDGYVKPRNRHEIRLIYNDLDNLRPVCARCNSMRNADRRTDEDIAEEVASSRQTGGSSPTRAIAELASTMTPTQLALAYRYMVAIKAGVITAEPPTTPDPGT